MRARFRDRKESESLPEPEILPMMNILFMLVMVLMGMSAFLPVGVINVHAPEIGLAGSASTESMADLKLTVMILKAGMNLSVAGSVYRFPKLQTGYDYAALREKLIAIKAQYPQSRQMILMAEPDIVYDDITHAMDAARPMFDEVALSPGLVQ